MALARTIVIGSDRGRAEQAAISLLLAHALSSHGRRVLLCDAGQSLPDLHLLLGAMPALRARAMQEPEYAPESPIRPIAEHLWLLPGGEGLEALNRLHRCFDRVLIDAGAGLEGLAWAARFDQSRILLLTTPEPAALTDAQGMIRALAERDVAGPIDILIHRAGSEWEGQAAFAGLALASERRLGRSLSCLGVLSEDAALAGAARQPEALARLIVTDTARQLRGLLLARLELAS